MELDGRVLVDGGVVDPVASRLVQRWAPTSAIAVNAVPRLKKDVQTVLAKLYRSAKRFDPDVASPPPAATRRTVRHQIMN